MGGTMKKLVSKKAMILMLIGLIGMLIVRVINFIININIPTGEMAYSYGFSGEMADLFSSMFMFAMVLGLITGLVFDFLFIFFVVSNRKRRRNNAYPIVLVVIASLGLLSVLISLGSFHWVLLLQAAAQIIMLIGAIMQIKYKDPTAPVFTPFMGYGQPNNQPNQYNQQGGYQQNPYNQQQGNQYNQQQNYPYGRPGGNPYNQPQQNPYEQNNRQPPYNPAPPPHDPFYQPPPQNPMKDDGEAFIPFNIDK